MVAGTFLRTVYALFFGLRLTVVFRVAGDRRVLRLRVALNRVNTVFRLRFALRGLRGLIANSSIIFHSCF